MWGVYGVGFLLLPGLWVWAIPGGNGKGKRKAEGVSLRAWAELGFGSAQK